MDLSLVDLLDPDFDGYLPFVVSLDYHDELVMDAWMRYEYANHQHVMSETPDGYGCITCLYS